MSKRATATLTIRNVDPSVRDRLRVRAVQNGRSMEAELRDLLAKAVAETPVKREETGTDLYADIRRRFAPHGFADDLVEAIPPRADGRPLPTFDD